MANLQGGTGIYPEGGYLEQLGFFSAANLSSGGGSYYHIKTNVTHQSYAMIMIEAVGYNYGTALPIRCAWNFYCYTYFFGSVQTSAYGGVTAHSHYVAADNRIVIVMYASSLYYCGFTLNAYNTAGNGYGTIMSVVSAVQTGTASYY